MSTRICSFNIRTECVADGINHFPYRKPHILSVIEREKPDIIGFQEVMPSGRSFFADCLTDYVTLGCGRGVNMTSEGVSIAYRKDKYDLFSYDSFWLSATPHVPASTYGGDQSNCPRMAQIAYLVPKDGGRPFLFCNTHLDHCGKNARMLGAMQILQQLSRYPDMPMILTGDLNATPDAPEIRLLSERMNDVTENVKGTYHGYGSCEPSKIDYIFTTVAALSPAYAAEDAPVDGVYCSDHYPVFCDIDL